MEEGGREGGREGGKEGGREETLNIRSDQQWNIPEEHFNGNPIGDSSYTGNGWSLMRTESGVCGLAYPEIPTLQLHALCAP